MSPDGSSTPSDAEGPRDLSTARDDAMRSLSLWLGAQTVSSLDGDRSFSSGSASGLELIDEVADSFADATCAGLQTGRGAITLGRDFPSSSSPLVHEDGSSADIGAGEQMAASLAAPCDAHPGSDLHPTLARASMGPHPWSARGLAGELLHTVLEGFPAKASSWARSLGKQRTQQLRQHVKIDVQPRILAGQEVALKAAAEENDWELDDFSVKVHRETGEVVAKYIQDEVALKATIEVPPAYPLDKPKVHFQCGLGKSQWQRWRMQLMALLTNRDGTFADAVALWKKNLDQELSGAEPCPICYSVISLGSMRLPTEQCGTCRKGFHGACVLRWFQSSGDNKCPMCRSEWARY